jgi:hypothetical protein
VSATTTTDAGERRQAVRDPHPVNRFPKIHVRNPDGLLGCGITGAFITEVLGDDDLAAVTGDQLCRRCFQVGQAVRWW